jgi:hypothetical protein
MAQRGGWLLRWARPSHPIVRYERRHWLTSRGWRLVRGLLWGGTLTFVLFPALCALIFNLTATFNSPGELILSLGGTFTLGLFFTSTLALWFNNLSASFLGATLIARERESQTWPLLRLTSLTSVDLLGGKLAALAYTLAGPMQLILALRALAIVSGLATLALAGLVSGVSVQDVREFLAVFLAEAPLGVTELFMLEVAVLGGALLTLATWLLEPMAGVVYNAAVGVAASTLARSRGTAVVLVVAAHFALGLGLYAPVQQVGLLALAPFIDTAMTANPLILPLLSVAVQTWLTLALWWGIVVGCLVFALRRVDMLSE